ncbi:AMP-binding protein [Hoeflea sp. TYP-13]|uniref:AMP-binding protein n=1 Tax=Hoeflea sp. TYP-13 TaxID=3230023 RepID=UPI0034C62637
MRGANFFSRHPAIIYGSKKTTYEDLYLRVRHLSSALGSAGLKPDQAVAVLAPNIPAMIECHFAVPLAGAVLFTQNPLLEPGVIARQWAHTKTALVICDQEYLPLANAAIEQAECTVQLVVISDQQAGHAKLKGMQDYEDFIGGAPDAGPMHRIDNERRPLCILCTSGTTSSPKGVVYSHRGAYLSALSNAISFGVTHNSVHLWTWPMYHSNGLSFVWTVTAVGATHICLRSVSAADLREEILRHRVSHLCLPPSLLHLLAGEFTSSGQRYLNRIQCITGGAPPPSSLVQRLEKQGITVVHQYGSSECHGPATVSMHRPEIDRLFGVEKREVMGRQGTPTPAVDDLMVAEHASLRPVPKDGKTLGEVLIRGNTVMLEYIGDENASKNVLDDGWFHTGDIALWHKDGSIEIKDRAVDAIVSNGVFVSSVEIEDILYGHPDILEVAVIAQPSASAGQSPCAFVTTTHGRAISQDELMSFCRSQLPADAVPTRFVFQDLPKTATGKIRKVELRNAVSKKGTGQ